MRLIDADAEEKRWCSRCSEERQRQCKTRPMCVSVQSLRTAPTAQAQMTLWEDI